MGNKFKNEEYDRMCRAIASCTCLTKTNDIEAHKKNCAYRIFLEENLDSDKEEFLFCLLEARKYIIRSCFMQKNMKISDILLESILSRIIEDIDKTMDMLVGGGYEQI